MLSHAAAVSSAVIVIAMKIMPGRLTAINGRRLPELSVFPGKCPPHLRMERFVSASQFFVGPVAESQ
jgi:hypothetical protein